MAGLGGVLLRFTHGIRLVRIDDGGLLADWSWPSRLTWNLAGGRSEAFATRSVPTDVIFSGRRSILPGESEIVQRQHLITMPETDYFGGPIVEKNFAYLTSIRGGEIVCVRLPPGSASRGRRRRARPSHRASSRNELPFDEGP